MGGESPPTKKGKNDSLIAPLTILMNKKLILEIVGTVILTDKFNFRF
jgi:hypothetical protein